MESAINNWPTPDQMTYGQRVELGKLAEEINLKTVDADLDAFYRIFAIMVPGYKPDVGDKDAVKYALEIVERYEYWVKAENKMLQSPPDAIAEQAGSKQLAKDLGDLGTLHAISTQFTKCPDEVLQWNYGTVFGMLYADKRVNEYRKKYNELSAKKATAEAKKKHRARRRR